ncbi:hypothetical protein IST419_05823 [Burkholderia multivorans]|nr:hypothetical protein IST419_05823 [Burkholderia multivorans]
MRTRLRHTTRLIVALAAFVATLRVVRSSFVQSDLPGVCRALCLLFRTGVFNASRPKHGLRRSGTLARPRQQARPQTAARRLGTRRRHGLANRRSRGALRRRRRTQSRLDPRVSRTESAVPLGQQGAVVRRLRAISGRATRRDPGVLSRPDGDRRFSTRDGRRVEGRPQALGAGAHGSVRFAQGQGSGQRLSALGHRLRRNVGHYRAVHVGARRLQQYPADRPG